MNLDLALMALDGLSRSPISIEVQKGEVVILGESAGFKEFARLCLLMGNAAGDDQVELQQGVHVKGVPVRLKLR